MCTNCEPIQGSGEIIISESAQPFCMDCGSDTHCVEKLDSACVVYHLNNPDKVSKLDNLGLGNGATAEEVFEAITDLIGNQFNVPLIVTDSPTVNLTASGISNHTLKADVILSTQSGNILQSLSDGLFVADMNNGKVKVDATDAADYLVNQLIGGTDGIVSISTVLTSGMIQILPLLDIDCLVDALGSSTAFQQLICRLVKDCAAACPGVTNIDIETTT